MALIGKLLKNALAITHNLSREESNPFLTQEKQLRSLLERAKHTSFGKYFGFEELLEGDDLIKRFKAEIPIHQYAEIHERWWHQQQKYPDITWPGRPDFFAKSSGTTGKTSKRIPITADFLDSMKAVGRSMIQSLPRFDFPEELFESEILMLSSSADLEKNEEGFLEGEISGINVSNFPDWYQTFYRPGKEIAAIDDWDERIQRIAEEAPKWNIGAIAGIPSWVLLMLKKVIEHNDLETIHDVWPNLKVYASGGVAYETYRKDFEEICREPLVIMDTYLASEGFVAFNSHPDTMAMELALDHGYFFEFIPFDERGVDEMGNILKDPLSLNIDEVELDQEYVLILSSCAGAWRYSIGDVIKFESLDPPQIKITGRTKFFLNVVGSQLSEEKLDAAVLNVSEKHKISINEYMVGAVKNDEDEYIHQWVMVSDDAPDALKLKDDLDNELKEANKNYAVARSKALKGISVKVIDKAQYTQYLDSTKKKGGQTKTPKVMGAEKMEELIKLL
jgi:hypothetical protein